MERFTANYSITNNNFSIENLNKKVDYKNKFFPIVCILKNIIQRGCPTPLSDYLTKYINKTDILNNINKIYFIDNEVPEWINLIKGDNENNYFPAKEFFYDIIPEYLSEYKYIQQLILPEASINEITGLNTEKFFNQCVDFYLPQAKLVIEIDGYQHNNINDKLKDNERDAFLIENGIKTIRINTRIIKEKGAKLKQKIYEIKNCLLDHLNSLKPYNDCNMFNITENSVIQNSIIATAIIRFQITILMLIERGQLKLDSKRWNLNVINRDVKGYEKIAINDLFIWIKNLCNLNKIDFIEPEIFITSYSNISEQNNNMINIDFSLKKRWTNNDQLKLNTIFVRTDYFEDKNYFKVSTSDPIKYKITVDGKNNNKSSLEFMLKNIFGFSVFREGQLPIILNVLSCYDTIGLLPTGSGKSICYQLSALLQPCISFVVVPIKSLMYDQKKNLDKKGIIHTDFISSDQDASEKEKVQNAFSRGTYQFIWISPERFQTKPFRNYLDELNRNYEIGIAVIDEVHCLSEWGHDFRTSYLNLAKTIRKYCPSATFLGLTATASEKVLRDILVDFEITKASVKTLISFSRPELTFIVKEDNGNISNQKKEQLNKLISDLSEKRDILEVDGTNTKCGIIFTPHVNGEFGCYKLSKDLSQKYKKDIRWYSGTVPKINKLNVMDDKNFNLYKKAVQEDFQDNKFPLLIATKAFGMGIDKSNIRYTIHYGIPNSLEALYQEAGRAGRDKKNAGCYILYSKEKIDKEKLNVIFDFKSTVDDIKGVMQNNNNDKRDVLRNIYMWLSSKNTIDEDLNSIKKVILKYAKPSEKNILIPCKSIGMNLAQLQQTLYRMGIMGIVDDWTIDDWNQITGKVFVDFLNYNNKSIYESIENYIRKYEKRFSIANIKNDVNYNEILKPDMEPYEIAAKLLLKWQYENISYSRRQSIKNLSDLCENYEDSKSFQNIIEDYFKFSDSVYNLDHIADNPEDCEFWFSLFFGTENGKEIKLVIQELESIKNSLSRFLESYRYNTGFNYISGMIRLILNDYQNKDGKDRLESAFTEIKKMSINEQNNILKNTLKIGQTYLEESSKQILSELLIREFNGQESLIYKELKDNYSLNFIINKSTYKIRNLRSKLV